MDLGLVGLAYRGFQDGQRQVKNDEALDKQRALQMAQSDAGLSLVPSKTEADQTGLALQTANNRANQSLLPGRTELAGLQNIGATADARFNNEQQPITQQTRAAGNQLGLGNAKFAVEQQPQEQAIQADSTKVRKALAEYSAEDLPGALNDMKRKRIFSDADVGTTAVAKLAELVQSGDGAAVIKFMNDMHKTGAMPAMNGKEVTQIGFTKDEKSGENILVALGADGKPVMQMSQKKLQAIRDSVGKTELKEVSAGASLVGIKGGQAKVLYEAPGKEDGNKTSEMQKQFEFLTKHPNGPKITTEKATEMIQKGAHKSPEERYHVYLQELVKSSFGQKLDMEKIKGQAAALSGVGATNPQAVAPASNTSVPPTINPQIKSLLGLPP